MCCEGDVHCDIWHWWGNTATCYTSKAHGKCCLLLHIPAALSSSSAQEKTTVVWNPIILHDNARSHTAVAVMDLLCRWQWEILEHPPYSPDMSPCNYYLFAKVKEPLRCIRYNTKYEFIHVIGWSIRNINKDGCTDGVQCLLNIWQKVMQEQAVVGSV